MPRQLISFEGTNNSGVKAKEFSSLLGALAVIRHDALLYIRQSCR